MDDGAEPADISARNLDKSDPDFAAKLELLYPGLSWEDQFKRWGSERQSTGRSQGSSSAAGTGSMGIAAGWYANPVESSFQWRYWNGQRWTSHVANQGSRLRDGAHKAEAERPRVSPPSSKKQGFGCGLALLLMPVAIAVVILAFVAPGLLALLVVIAVGFLVAKEKYRERRVNTDTRPPVPNWPPPNGFRPPKITKSRTPQDEFDARLNAAVEAVESGDNARREQLFEDALRHFDTARTRAREAILIAPVASKSGRVGTGLFASAITGGFGWEDLLIGPIVGHLVGKVRKNALNSLAAEVYTAASVRSLETLALLLGSDSAAVDEAAILSRACELYAFGEEVTFADNNARTAFLTERVPAIAEIAPQLNGMLANFAHHFGWSDVLQILRVYGVWVGDREQDQASDRAGGPGPSMNFAHACDLLRVREDATRSEVRSAFRSKAKEWHPDRLGDVPDELRDIAAEKMKELNDAYKLLLATVPDDDN